MICKILASELVNNKDIKSFTGVCNSDHAS